MLTGLGDDGGFLGIVLGVEDLMRNIETDKKLIDDFGLFDRRRTDKDRLTERMTSQDFPGESFILGLFIAEDEILIVDTLNRTVGRNRDDTHVVDLTEFFLFGLGSTGHTGKLVVKTEEVLIGDGGKRNGFRFDFDMFLGFQSLLETIGIFTAFHDTAGEAIDKFDGIVADHVLDITLHDVVGLQSLLDTVGKIRPLSIIEVIDGEHAFNLLDTLIG